MSTICDYCNQPPADDEATHCVCGGKFISSSVLRDRQVALVDQIEATWDAYHAIREGDAAIAKRAEPTYQTGALLRRQAG